MATSKTTVLPAATSSKKPVAKKAAATPVEKKPAAKKAAVTAKKPAAKVAAVKKPTVKVATAKKPAAKVVAPAAKKPAATVPVKKVAAKKVEKPAIKQIAASAPKKTGKKNTVTPEERYEMIATAAYFLAEQRGFAGGYEREDWISGEAQIDAKLKKGVS